MPPPALTRSHLLMFGVLLVAVLAISARGLLDPDVGWPDADRVLMDGLFVHDFLREFDFSHLWKGDFIARAYQYAIGYFAQYPALSLGSRPPLFPAVEAVFFFLFGVSDASAKLSLLGFTLLGMVAWHDLIRRTHDQTTALFATGLLFTAPFIVQWVWYPMLEIPALALILVTANLFWRFADTGQAKWLYWTILALSLALWTKQTSLFAIPWFLAWLLITGRLKATLTRRSTWLAVSLGVLLTLPLAVLTVWMGKTNLALAFQGVDQSSAQLSWTSWAFLRQYLDLLVQVQLPLPVLLLSGLGALTALLHRDRQALFFLLLILTTYLFFTALHSYRIDRYTIFWVPGFALFAALPWYHLRAHPWSRPVGYLVMLALLGLQIQQSINKTPAFTRGHREAAQLAMHHSRSGRIFMDGINNGYFTCFVRLNDPGRRHHVLRGDKLLHSSSVFTEHATQIHVRDLAGIRTLLDQHGIDILVIEERNYAQLEIHQILRDFLKTDAFELLKTIPIHSTRSQLMNQNLLVYRYREAKPPSIDRFSLSVPLVGKSFEVPVAPGSLKP
ncbi:MAG: glycosyltransferase family 39 protein [Magnetococcales bacterium]|nr:glycosyltransferase family 39 protein [Magnetococcales bacterium]